MLLVRRVKKLPIYNLKLWRSLTLEYKDLISNRIKTKYLNCKFNTTHDAKERKFQVY